MKFPMKNVISFLFVLLAAPAWSISSHALTIENLRTEYLTNPVGLEERSPRFSWILVSDERGAKQDTYRIQVSSTPDGAPDLWDSGTVQSAETVNVVYEGKPLKSRQRCFWTVTVNGVESEPASWTIGFLDANDWTADWISFKDDTPLAATQSNVVLPAACYYRKPFSADRATPKVCHRLPATCCPQIKPSRKRTRARSV